MKNILTIFQKELKSYFYSPIAYVVLTLFAFITGYVFYLIFTTAAQISMQGMRYGGTFNAPQFVVRNLVGWISTVLLFLIPLITMGVYAEEKKKGTFELLFTSPVTNTQVIFGKFIANFIFTIVLFAGALIALSPLFLTKAPAYGPLVTAFVGLILFSAAILSLGNFLSSLTENQIVSAVLTFVLVLLLWLLSILSRGGTEGVQGILAYLSPLQHLEDFQKGVLDLSNVIYFLSVWAFGMFLTYRSLESLRWRG